MIQMPWDNRTAPNVMVEITDACNIRCLACYKRLGTSFKPLAQIDKDIDDATRLRTLHTVTLSGGEPSLHPDLCKIIQMAKQKVPHVFLLTNGVALDGNAMREMKENGLDSILFHVDSGQTRPDIVEGSGFPGLAARLAELCEAARACGLDVAVSATLYGSDIEFLRKLIVFVINSPEITFLFISRAVSPETLLPVGGASQDAATALSEVCAFLKNEYKLEPFAGIPATDNSRIVWLSYFIPVVHHMKRRPMLFVIRSNWADLALMKFHRMLTGRYLHRTTQQPMITFLRTTINAAVTLRVLPLAKFLIASVMPGTRLLHKTIAYDAGPSRATDGGIVHCVYCPTAIVRNGQLLPCCTADFALTDGRTCA